MFDARDGEAECGDYSGTVYVEYLQYHEWERDEWGRVKYGDDLVVDWTGGAFVADGEIFTLEFFPSCYADGD